MTTDLTKASCVLLATQLTGKPVQKPVLRVTAENGVLTCEALDPSWEPAAKTFLVNYKAMPIAGDKWVKQDDPVAFVKAMPLQFSGTMLRAKLEPEVEASIDYMREHIRWKALSVAAVAHKLDGYTSFQGLPISIENKKGSVRSGVNSHTGKEWSVTMPFDYGYIKGTKGADGQAVDVFLGPIKDAKFVFIVHQNKPDGSDYDEDKVFLGFKSADAAKAAYNSAYDNGGEFFHSMTVLPMHEFIRKVLDTKNKRPGKIHAEAL